MPVRKIPKNYLGVTGSFSSKKNGRALGFESLLERDYMILLEFDPDVESFEEQPVRIPVVSKGRTLRCYVPDILVHYRARRGSRSRRPVLAEVKKRSDLEKHKEKYAPKFSAARKFAAEQGWEFRIIPDNEIRIPRLPNLKFLREYHLIEPEPSVVHRVLAAVQAMGDSSTLQNLLHQMNDSETERLHTIPVIWHLVATGVLQVDLDRPITNETVITLLAKGKRP